MTRMDNWSIACSTMDACTDDRRLGRCQRLPGSALPVLGISQNRSGCRVTARGLAERCARLYPWSSPERSLAGSFRTMGTTVHRSSEAQRRLIAHTAHSLRNPMSALSIQLQTLEPAILPAGEQVFRDAGAELERLFGLLDSLLVLASAETPDTTHLHDEAGLTGLQRCDAFDVTGKRVDVRLPAFRSAGIELSLQPRSDDAAIAAPTAAAEQILDVVLSNACQHAGTGARVRVSIDCTRGPDTTITVSDNGIGVRDNEIGKLTRRFFRSSTATSGGSGLGLPIAAALARKHHGQLMIRRSQPNGSTVAIEIPSADSGIATFIDEVP
jgi:signal transduction histidine kinase